MISKPNEDNVIREVVNRKASHVGIVDTHNKGTCEWELIEML